MELKIEQLYEEDLALSTTVIRLSFAPVAAEFGLNQNNCPGNGAFLQEDVLKDLFRRGVLMFGLFLRGTLVGFVALKPKKRNMDSFGFPSVVKEWYVEKLSVLPEHRNHGFGATLIRAAAQAALDRGGESLHIGIIAENQRLKNWYEKQGFKETGIKNFPHLPFTVCYMQMPLVRKAGNSATQTENTE